MSLGYQAINKFLALLGVNHPVNNFWDNYLNPVSQSINFKLKLPTDTWRSRGQHVERKINHEANISFFTYIDHVRYDSESHGHLHRLYYDD
jgi:hypothetical protein